MCRPLKKRDESLGSDVDLKYLNYLLTLLEDPYSQYYSRGYLNSEGLTILYKVLRILSRVDKSLLNMLKTCFKNRDYEHIVNKIRIVREKLGLVRFIATYWYNLSPDEAEDIFQENLDLV